MQPARSIGQCTVVTAGEVSVAPQAEVNHTGVGLTLRATFSSLSQVLWGRAAPA